MPKQVPLTMDWFSGRVARFLRYPDARTSWITPQRGAFRTQLHIPNSVDLPVPAFVLTGNYNDQLPATDVPLKLLVFDFFSSISPQNNQAGVAALETQERAQSLENHVLIWAITAVNGQNPVQGDTGFQLQFYLTHQGKQRQFFHKHMNGGEVTGTAQAPFFLKDPLFAAKGDVIECEAKNLSRAANNALIQVVLWTRQLLEN